jgi:hypothetical protein
MCNLQVFHQKGINDYCTRAQKIATKYHLQYTARQLRNCDSQFYINVKNVQYPGAIVLCNKGFC